MLTSRLAHHAEVSVTITTVIDSRKTLSTSNRHSLVSRQFTCERLFHYQSERSPHRKDRLISVSSTLNRQPCRKALNAGTCLTRDPLFLKSYLWSRSECRAPVDYYAKLFESVLAFRSGTDNVVHRLKFTSTMSQRAIALVMHTRCPDKLWRLARSARISHSFCTTWLVWSLVHLSLRLYREQSSHFVVVAGPCRHGYDSAHMHQLSLCSKGRATTWRTRTQYLRKNSGISTGTSSQHWANEGIRSFGRSGLW
jgi:hypothetical protein